MTDKQNDEVINLDVRAELDSMTKEELIEEVLGRIEFTQSLIVSNWESNQLIERENKAYRESIETGYVAMKNMKNSIVFWQFAFITASILGLVGTFYS